MFFHSFDGRKIELTKERKQHIFIYHPEIRSVFSAIPVALGDPDEVRISKEDSRALLFYKYFPTIRKGKYLVVVVKTNKRNFILTSYLTTQIRTGRPYYEKK